MAEDKTQKCVMCKKEFVIDVTQQEWFRKKDWPLPKRCKKCRDKRKLENGDATDPDWGSNCIVCGVRPVMVGTGLCAQHTNV